MRDKIRVQHDVFTNEWGRSMAETSAAAVRRGNKLLKEKKFQEAQSCFEEIIRREPLNGKARLGRLLAIYQVEKLDELLEKEKDFVCSEPFASWMREQKKR